MGPFQHLSALKRIFFVGMYFPKEFENCLVPCHTRFRPYWVRLRRNQVCHANPVQPEVQSSIFTFNAASNAARDSVQPATIHSRGLP